LIYSLVAKGFVSGLILYLARGSIPTDLINLFNKVLSAGFLDLPKASNIKG
jgi:hypothetical protein